MHRPDLWLNLTVQSYILILSIVWLFSSFVSVNPSTSLYLYCYLSAKACDLYGVELMFDIEIERVDCSPIDLSITVVLCGTHPCCSSTSLVFYHQLT